MMVTTSELIKAIETPEQNRTFRQRALVDDYTRKERLNERDQRAVPKQEEPTAAKPIPTIAGNTLRRVADLLDGARHETHGEKVASFQAIARRWSGYGRCHACAELSGTDYALMMAEMKMERIRQGGVRMEHLEDVIGYAACAVQLAVAEGLIKLDGKG